MKEIKTFPLALAFAGSFLGAGFVSGQELWQFFGAFGVMGYIGLLLACALLVAIGIVLMRVLQMTGLTDCEQIMIPWEKPFLRKASGIFMNAFLLGVVVIMTAGVGATVEQLMGIPSALASAVFAALLGIVALAGVQGMMKVFSALVPTIVVATILFAVISWFRFGTDGILTLQPQAQSNPLMPNWFLAALTYVAYNLLGAIGILSPLGSFVQKKKTVWFGISLGGLLLVIVAGCVLTSLTGYKTATEAQMPMVALASQLKPVLGLVYGVLLLFGMFSNGLATLVAFMEYVNQRSKRMNAHRKISMALLMIVVWASSLAGFGNLVGTVFPIFGYIGIVLIVCIIIHFVLCLRQAKHPEVQQ